MKINEVYEGLIENGDNVYEMEKNGQRYVLRRTEYGYFYLDIYNSLGCLINPEKGDGGFNGNLLPGDEWNLVRKPVDFMTAVNSGKLFKPESWIWNSDDKFRNLYDNLQMFSGRQMVQAKILNGKWYIE